MSAVYGVAFEVAILLYCKPGCSTFFANRPAMVTEVEGIRQMANYLITIIVFVQCGIGKLAINVHGV